MLNFQPGSSQDLDSPPNELQLKKQVQQVVWSLHLPTGAPKPKGSPIHFRKFRIRARNCTKLYRMHPSLATRNTITRCPCFAVSSRVHSIYRGYLFHKSNTFFAIRDFGFFSRASPLRPLSPSQCPSSGCRPRCPPLSKGGFGPCFPRRTQIVSPLRGRGDGNMKLASPKRANLFSKPSSTFEYFRFCDFFLLIRAYTSRSGSRPLVPTASARKPSGEEPGKMAPPKRQFRGFLSNFMMPLGIVMDGRRTLRWLPAFPSSCFFLRSGLLFSPMQNPNVIPIWFQLSKFPTNRYFCTLLRTHRVVGESSKHSISSFSC